MGVHDATFDVRIAGYVAKPGRHREFVWGQVNPVTISPRSFERSCRRARLTQCLADTSTALMDLRHRGEVLSAGAAIGLELENPMCLE